MQQPQSPPSPHTLTTNMLYNPFKNSFTWESKMQNLDEYSKQFCKYLKRSTHSCVYNLKCALHLNALKKKSATPLLPGLRRSADFVCGYTGSSASSAWKSLQRILIYMNEALWIYICFPKLEFPLRRLCTSGWHILEFHHLPSWEPVKKTVNLPLRLQNSFMKKHHNFRNHKCSMFVSGLHITVLWQLRLYLGRSK